MGENNGVGRSRCVARRQRAELYLSKSYILGNQPDEVFVGERRSFWQVVTWVRECTPVRVIGLLLSRMLRI